MRPLRTSFQCITHAHLLLGLRVTEDTELGDNDSVKQPKDAVPMNNRRARKQEKQQAAG